MKSMQAKYDALADVYHRNRHTFDIRFLFDRFYAHLPMSSGLVLDLGCGIGDGFPEYFLEKGWSVKGVDFSSKMVELATQYHPQMPVACEALENISLPAHTYDVIESVYTLFHLSNAAQKICLKKCYDALKPGGFLYFTYAGKEYTGHETYEGFVSFMGEELFYAHERPEDLKTFLEETGFRHIKMLPETIGGETFYWVEAQKD